MACANVYEKLMMLFFGWWDQNAPMRFNALAIENLMASRQDLSNRIFIHYSDQFVYQIHRMLGSADFLGNPGESISYTYIYSGKPD